MSYYIVWQLLNYGDVLPEFISEPLENDAQEVFEKWMNDEAEHSITEQEF